MKTQIPRTTETWARFLDILNAGLKALGKFTVFGKNAVTDGRLRSYDWLKLAERYPETWREVYFEDVSCCFSLPCFVYSASFLFKGELLSSYWSWRFEIQRFPFFDDFLILQKIGLPDVLSRVLSTRWTVLRLPESQGLTSPFLFLDTKFLPEDPSSSDHWVCWRAATSRTVLQFCERFLALLIDLDWGTRQELSLQ